MLMLGGEEGWRGGGEKKKKTYRKDGLGEEENEG